MENFLILTTYYRALCAGNHTVSSLIWNQFARVSFSKIEVEILTSRLLKNSQVQHVVFIP